MGETYSDGRGGVDAEKIMADLAGVLGWEKTGNGWEMTTLSSQVFRVALDVTLESWGWERADGEVRVSVELRDQATGDLLTVPISQLRVIKDGGDR